jgi:hypothetical protein
MRVFEDMVLKGVSGQKTDEILRSFITFTLRRKELQ